MSRKPSISPAAIDDLVRGCIIDTHVPGLLIEATTSGKKTWKYRRRLARVDVLVRMRLGQFPAIGIADARKWATALNDQVERGVDPREAIRADAKRLRMTVDWGHELYMTAVYEGRASRAKRKNKPRTISEKQEIYERDIRPKLGAKSMYEISEKDLISLVNAKGAKSPIRANRLAAELKVFFGWAAGLRGTEVGLEVDPARRLGDLKYPEHPRERKLSLEEIGWYLQAVAEEKDLTLRRGLLVLLLTAARRNEVTHAHSDEIAGGKWTIPAERSKNGSAHSIQLGPWGRNLMSYQGWIFPAAKIVGPRKTGWYPARNRVHQRMVELAGRDIPRFSPHDLRRTARSNTKRLDVLP